MYKKVTFSWLLFVITIIPVMFLVIGAFYVMIAGYRPYSPEGLVFAKSYGIVGMELLLTDLFSIDIYGKICSPTLIFCALYQILFLTKLR